MIQFLKKWMRKGNNVKNIKLVLLVLMLLAVSLSCRLFTRTRSSNAPAVDFGKPAEPLNVTVQLDKTHTASGKVLPTGGGLSLTAADGSVFTLEVPAKALAADTMITMTRREKHRRRPAG